MIVLFTDFGYQGPYVGQMKAVIYRLWPEAPIVDLFADAPTFDPVLSAHLLAAYVEEFPPGSVFLCVVDPGVGTQQRRPVVVSIDGRSFVGPDNGLFDVVMSRGAAVRKWEITWCPPRLSASFHGRDLFAPVAARLGAGECPEEWLMPLAASLDQAVADDLDRVIYLDSFGNAMTGRRAAGLGPDTRLRVAGQELARARTFAEVPAGGLFWYENANGLVEIAQNRGSARGTLGLELGANVEVLR